MAALNDNFVLKNVLYRSSIFVFFFGLFFSNLYEKELPFQLMIYIMCHVVNAGHILYMSKVEMQLKICATHPLKY